MLGSKPLSLIFGSAPDPTDHAAMRSYISTLCDQGLAVLLCYPGTKKPFDGRTVTIKNRADKAAAAEAQAAGRRNWKDVKSASGLALATTDKKQFTKKNGYLDEYLKVFNVDEDNPVAINVAIELGGSGLIVVDCDTDNQKLNFLETAGATEEMPPMVVSPGTRGADGEWIHEPGNGHYYFTLTDEQRARLPENMGALTWGGEDGFAVLWRQRYVLIPPSRRKEGAYERVGKEYECPDWLIDELVAHAEAKQSRYVDNNVGPTDDLGVAIDEWAESVSWADLLEPLGWAMRSRPDNCGCDVWTAPGPHSSDKSATAHDAGCSLGRYTEANAPLKIWTDNPGEPFAAYVSETGHTAISKLQVFAWAHHEGSVGAAMDSLGLSTGGTELERSMGIDNNAVLADSGVGHDASAEFSLPDRSTAPDDVDPIADAVAELERDHQVELGTADEMRPEDVAEAQQTTPPGYLTKRCWECDVVEPVENFQVDADGDWWHYDAEDNAHLAGPEEESYTVGPVTQDEVNAVAEELDVPPFSVTEDDDDVPAPVSDIFESGVAGLPVIAPFSHWRDMPPPEYVIDRLIEHGGLSCIIGKPGIGKSCVALDMALSVATGRPWQGRKTLKTRVLYLPGEGLSGTISRIKAWSHEHDVPHEVIDDGIRVANDIVRVGASNEAWGLLAEYILRQKIGLVFFDTFARAATGIEENSATEVGKAVVRLDNLRRLTNCGVVLVHHTSKGDPRAGRGSSALNGALDSELLLSDASWSYEDLGADNPPSGKPLEMDTTKQKNAEQLEEPIPLLMRSCETIDAPYITGATGTVDPMLGEVTLARPRPEPTVETAIRIREFLSQFTETFQTKAEIAAGVMPDPYTRSRTDSAKAWKQTIALAIDTGMRYGLIEHPVNPETENVLTTKFTAGGQSVEGARTAHAKTVMSEGSED